MHLFAGLPLEASCTELFLRYTHFNGLSLTHLRCQFGNDCRSGAIPALVEEQEMEAKESPIRRKEQIPCRVPNGTFAGLLPILFELAFQFVARMGQK